MHTQNVSIVAATLLNKVLVGSRNEFEHDLTNKLIQFEGLMENCLRCQTSTLVEYRQKQK